MTERRYFGVTNPHGFHEVWWLEGNRAARVMPEPLPSQNSSLTLVPGAPFDRSLIALLSDDSGVTPWTVAPMVLRPGQYYPRMARPTDVRPDDSPGHYPALRDMGSEVAHLQRQLSDLTQRLDRACRIVYPAPDTLKVYGDELRELLILACTEVEASWRAILRANGVAEDRPNTRHYVALQDAMRLGEYAVTFPTFPRLQAFRPFAGWGASEAPTKDLPWYDAYNAVKHSREENFTRATLEQVFTAVAACAVMLCGQFGRGALRHGLLEEFLHLEATPRWPYTEVYTWIYRDHDEMMMAVAYPPRELISATPVPYPFALP